MTVFLISVAARRMKSRISMVVALCVYGLGLRAQPNDVRAIVHKSNQLARRRASVRTLWT